MAAVTTGEMLEALKELEVISKRTQLLRQRIEHFVGYDPSKALGTAGKELDVARKGMYEVLGRTYAFECK